MSDLDLAFLWEQQARDRYTAASQLSDTARGLIAAEAEVLLRCAAQLRELIHGRAGRGSWFVGQVTPEQHAYGWLREEDGTPTVLWRPYLQAGGDAIGLSVTFRSREDCEKFIHEEVLPGDH